MPDWLAQNIGTVLTVGGSILIAIITGAFALWAKNHTPKQPVPIQDVWSENRSLRADLLGVERRFDLLDVDYRKVLNALDVLWRYVQRVRAAWGTHPTMPALTPAERRTLSPLIEDLDTNGAGSPVTSN
jgi:hypothetical protein